MIEKIGDIYIDLSKIEMVGKHYGDSAWKRYRVHFTGGSSIEIHEDRKYFEKSKLIQMEREKLIDMWKKSKSER